jgi:TPR repeat protein
VPDPKPAAVNAPEQQPNPAGSTAPPSPATDQPIDPALIEQAKAGNAAAQYQLGYDYYLGRGIAQDYAQAAVWWRKAADQGFAEAMNNLGVLYNSGKGVPQSYAEAYFWENLAAARANGPLQAQFAKNRDDSGSNLWLFARLSVQRRAAKWAAAHPVAPRTAEPRSAHQ